MTRILLTGATGYVGGQVLHTLTRTHPNLQIAALIRSSEKATEVQKAYPKIHPIVGDLDNTCLLEKEASASDIVLHLAATGHIASAKAIATGLQTRHKKTGTKATWIQISGATAYAADEIAHHHFGHPTSTTYDDIRDASRILELLRSNAKRVVENTVLDQSPEHVRTALIIGPLIYGAGEGPGNRRSIQGPEIARVTLESGHGVVLGAGGNSWSHVHVRDLAEMVALLVSAAVEGREGMWNGDGVFNVEGGELTFKELGVAIAKEAFDQGLIKEGPEKIETIDAKRADELSAHASVLWGTNARAVARKAREVLGWKPVGETLVESLPALVKKEAEART